MLLNESLQPQQPSLREFTLRVKMFFGPTVATKSLLRGNKNGGAKRQDFQVPDSFLGRN